MAVVFTPDKENLSPRITVQREGCAPTALRKPPEEEEEEEEEEEDKKTMGGKSIGNGK